MTHRSIFRVGIVGAVVAAICCVTPLLPWLLGAAGLSGMVGYVYRDDVLFSLVAVFLAIATARAALPCSSPYPAIVVSTAHTQQWPARPSKRENRAAGDASIWRHL